MQLLLLVSYSPLSRAPGVSWLGGMLVSSSPSPSPSSIFVSIFVSVSVSTVATANPKSLDIMQPGGAVAGVVVVVVVESRTDGAVRRRLSMSRDIMDTEIALANVQSVPIRAGCAAVSGLVGTRAEREEVAYWTELFGGVR